MANPTADAGADQVIDLSAVSFPQNKSFDGVASSPGSGSIITGWDWELLDEPPGSGATLADPTTQTPDLNGIDTWGNHRLFLKVKNDLNVWSEQDPLLAPDSAFVIVRIQSAKLGIEKPAKGERNWQQPFRDTMGDLEQLKTDFDNRTVAGISDTHASTTGVSLRHNTEGNYATDDGLAGGTPLHKHPVGTVDPATTTTLGTVKLAEAALDPANPKAVTKDRMGYAGTVQGTYQNTGWIPRIKPPNASGGAGSLAHMAYYVQEPFTCTEFTAILADGGLAADTYVIKLYKMTTTQYAANDFAGATLMATVNLSPASDHEGIAADVPTFSQALILRDVVAVKVEGGPAADVDLGHTLSCVIAGKKEW